MDDAKRGPEGIGGWLALLCVTIGAAWPSAVLAGLIPLYSDPGLPFPVEERWAAVVAMEWTLAIGSVLGCWYLLWRLLARRVWSTVRSTIAAMWILAVAMPVLEPLLFSLITDRPMPAALADGSLSFIVQLLAATFWSIYLRNARRVANTYRRPGALPDLGKVFS
jgi:hypothetical protein